MEGLEGEEGREHVDVVLQELKMLDRGSVARWCTAAIQRRSLLVAHLRPIIMVIVACHGDQTLITEMLTDSVQTPE